MAHAVDIPITGRTELILKNSIITIVVDCDGRQDMEGFTLPLYQLDHRRGQELLATKREPTSMIGTTSFPLCDAQPAAPPERLIAAAIQLPTSEWEA